LSHNHSTQELCRIALVSRSGFYKFQNNSKKFHEDELQLVDSMKAIQKSVNNTYGYRRMKIAVESELKIAINHKKVARIQKELGFQAKIRRKRFSYPKQSFGYEGPKKNILNRNFTTEAPNQKWVTDITYINNGSTRMYLSALLDLFNREIIAYRLSESLELPFVLETFQEGFSKYKPENVLIHSDQGGHYTAPQFCNLLRTNKAVQSMSRRGNCWDNAVMENFFSQLKIELIYRLQNLSKVELQRRIDDYIVFYNTKRIRTEIKMAPVDYRSHFSQTA
jgi:putative transposase